MTEPSRTAAPDHLRSFARSLPMALLKAREAVMMRFRPALRAHGLTEQQWRVLRAMSAADHRLRPMELAQMTFISMPSLSRLLKTLESRELVVRARHAGDQRGAEFGLTEAGRAIVAEIAPDSERAYAEIEQLVGGADVEQLYHVLEQVTQRLGMPEGEGLE